MPETPKFKNKNKVKIWFNGVARETLAGENTPVRNLSPIKQQQI